MRFAISGAHSTGKSMALESVRKSLEAQGRSVGVVSDLAISCPLPILRSHTPESSLWIASRGISDEIASEYLSHIVLVDRPVVDAWGYLQATSETINRSGSAYRTLETLIRTWMPSYAMVFSTVLDPAIPIDGTKGRDMDEGYRRRVAEHIRRAYKHFSIDTIDLTSGSVTDIGSKIDEFLSKRTQEQMG